MLERKPVVGVSVCLFCKGDVLLIQRKRPPFQDLWSLPGGRVEFGETLANAARRELIEETGAVVRDLAFVRLHEAIDVAGGAHAVIAVFRALDDHDGNAAIAAADDAADAGFFSIEAVRRMQTEGCTTAGLVDVIEAARLEDGA